MFGRSFAAPQANTFGFGTGTSTSFGQPNQLFGGSTSTFGSGSSGFGSTTQPIFGTTQQTTAPLFGSTTTPAFGQSNQSSGFGSSLFGNAQQPSSSSGIFGSTASTSFGQQAKPNTFGFPSSSASGLFGQNAQTQQQTAPSMFSATASTPLFGSNATFGTGQSQTGTVNKFVPVTGTDQVQKSGVLQTINTKHHCITCMKEYENKSLEELRCEDYQANRKGSQQQPPSFASTNQPFGIASTNSNLFGQTENKPVFGQATTGFSQPSFGLTSQAPATNMFGKSSTGFGQTSTTNSFSFGTGTASTGLFGTSTATKPFGTTPTQPLFGTTQPQQTTFGTNIFGQAPTQAGTQNLFGKPSQQGFNMGQSTFHFGTQPANQTSVFQTSKPNTTGFNIFGQPNNASTSTFGQPQQQTTFTPFNNFGKPAQPVFGQNNQLAFGTGLQASSLLGNNQPKSLFTSNNPIFGASGFQPNTGFTMPTQQLQQQPISNLQTVGENPQQDHRSFLQMADSFGYQPHLDGLSPSKMAASSYTTNPKELQKYLEAPQRINFLSPHSKRMKLLPPVVKKVNIFEDDFNNSTSDINFTLRRSAKRLVLKKESAANLSSDDDDSEIEVLDVDGYKGETSHQTKAPPVFVHPLRLKSNPLLPDDFSCSEITSLYGSSIQISEKGSKTESQESSNTAIMLPSEEISLFHGDTQLSIPDKPPIDTCGITLTRPEYYTIPALDKIAENKEGDGVCLVRGFTIGRVGFGSVSFPELMNVANLNLDKLVSFLYRQVSIYPDDRDKPPEGEGLNRRAQVTLDRVFPKTPNGRELVTDVETLISMNFTETLRALCDRNDTTFVDYRPETGSWVFMVEHFSKYGYNDSDEEDELPSKKTQGKNEKDGKKSDDIEDVLKVIKKPKKPTKEVMEETIRTSHPGDFHSPILMDDDDIMLEDDQLQSDSVMSDAGESIDNIDMDIATIPSSDNLHQVKSRRDLYKTNGDNIFLMKATLFEDDVFVPVNIESDNIETIASKTGKLIKDFARRPQFKKRVDRLDNLKPHVFDLQNNKCITPMDKSLYNNRNYMDIGVFKGRSFKVGWSRGLVLASLWNGFQNTQDIEAKTKIEILDVSDLTESNSFSNSLPEHLQLILEASEVTLVSGVPIFKMNRAKDILLKHQEIATGVYLQDEADKDITYYKEIWDLIVALWGEVPYGENRRKQLSKWFQTVLKTPIEEELKQFGETGSEDDIFEKIYIHLTGYQLMEASILAMRNNLPNLALFISQMNFSAKSRELLLDQMSQWKASMALDIISEPIQKIYMLFSGLLLQGDQNNPESFVNVCENLNWRQCFAIMLWYIIPGSEKIKVANDLYAKCFQKDSIAKRPTPTHLNENCKIFDIQYHLIQLRINDENRLEDILDPFTHSNYGGDYRLSWLLMEILTGLNVGIINDETHTYLTTSFSIQLESLCLPKWAVFVLLFIKDASLRKNLLMSCLHRSLATDCTDKIEDEFVKDMCIPAEWIHEVKAYKTRLLSMHWQCYKHLCHTSFWEEAHRIAIDNLIPDLIINEKFNITKMLLEKLREHKSIKGWNEQGLLLLDFFKIVKAVDRNQELDKDLAVKMHSALLEFCTRIHSYPMRTSKECATVSEISKRCYIYAKTLLKLMNPTYRGIISVTEFEIDRLVMPADYIFADLVNDYSTCMES